MVNNMEEKDKKLSGDMGAGFFRILGDHPQLTIFKYLLFLFVIAALIAAMVLQWGKVQVFIGRVVESLAPFFAALLLAYFVAPLVDWIQCFLRKRISRERMKKPIKYLSIFLAYMLVLAFVSLAVTFVVPQLITGINELASNVPVMYNHVYDFLMNIEKRYPDLDLEYFTEQLNDMVPNLVEYGTNIMGSVLPLVYSLSVSAVRLVINILLSVMISVYMISGRKEVIFQFKRLVYALFSEEKAPAVWDTCRECNNIFSAFLIGKAVDSLIIGILCCLAMSILRLPYAVLLSVVVGVTNMIPYFGPFIGAVPGVLIYLCTSPREAVIFAIMILVLQQFDGLVLGPRILGQSTGLGPMWVIFAITVGGSFFGVLGMFIGVPVVAVVAYLINKAIKFRLGSRNIPELKRPSD